MKIAFIAPPYSGHLFPQIYLAKELLKYTQEHEIVFMTGIQKKVYLEEQGFEVITIFEQDPNFFDNLIGENGKVSMFQQFNNVTKIIGEGTNQITKALKHNKIELAIIDFITYPATFSVSALKIPWITTMATAFAIENKDGTPAFCGGLMPNNSLFGRSRDFLARKLVRIVKKTLIFSAQKYLKPYIKNLYTEDQLEKIYSPYLILGMSVPSLQFFRSYPIQYRFIGYGAVGEDVILDIPFSKYKKSVLITFGTMHKNRTLNALEYFEKVALEFPETLFVISLGRIEQTITTKSFENILVHSFVSYERYMSQFDFVIHHGGAGIVHTTLKYGKPAIVIPTETDQYDFAARLQYYKVAIWVKKMNVNKIIDAINSLETYIDYQKIEVIEQELLEYNSGKLLEQYIENIVNEVSK